MADYPILCVAGKLAQLTNPPRRKCIYCDQVWSQDQPTPVCLYRAQNWQLGTIPIKPPFEAHRKDCSNG